jgi:hypothetical protein
MNFGRIFAGNVIWLSKIRKIEKRKKRRRKGGQEVIVAEYDPNIFFEAAAENAFAEEPGRNKGRSQTTVEITYRMDIAWKVCKGPGDVLRMYFNAADLVWDNLTPPPSSPLPTGRFNPTLGADSDFNPRQPPTRNAGAFWAVSGNQFRFNADASTAGVEVLPSGGKIRNGTLNVKDGGFIAVKSYPGTFDQPIDPTMQTEIDARRGAGSTSAHRGDIVVVVRDLNLSVYGNSIPNATFLVHSVKTSLKEIAEDLCQQAKIPPERYDFSAWATVRNRGFLISDRTPLSQEIDSLLRIYNLDIVETDGVIRGIVRGSELPVDIPQHFLGCEEEAEGKLTSRIDLSVANENELPRELEVRYYGTPKLEPEVAREFRRTGDFTREESLDVPITLTPAEAEGICKREFYRAHFESTGASVQLPWRYCRLKPGEVIRVETENGIEAIRIQEIQGAVPGALKVSGPQAFIETDQGGS